MGLQILGFNSEAECFLYMEEVGISKFPSPTTFTFFERSRCCEQPNKMNT